MQSELLDRICTDYCIFRKNVNAVLRCFRIELSGGTELLDRAHHAVRLHAAQLALFDLDAALSHLSVMIACDPSAVQYDRNLVAFFYIRSTGHDLNRLSAYIYLADDQMIGIRVLLDLLDLSDHNFVQIAVCRLISLHLCS